MTRRQAFLAVIVLAISFVVPRQSRCDGPAVLEITQDTVLDPNRTYGRLVIMASNVTVDGRGASLEGPGTSGEPTTFQSVGILSQGHSHVTLKNVRVKGWETGLVVRDGSDWTIENCNFSDNFHDPKFGWGENGRRGGMLLQRLRHSVIRNNHANRVWDACVLVDSHENRLETNDFSHTSNTCLKLWNSARNQVVGNNLSYGIRKDPGEVHARDSTCVLIESGSNDNRFLRNDCTHGGDGIFVRVLNGWVSTNNLFQENDCSFANNNCVEAWSPRNTYIGNKANHGSYGFWLGASDQTILLDNEASFNGLPTSNHNSPHLPDQGHAGIVFMFGPSSHTVVRGNRCIGNNGAGIAMIGDVQSQGKKWKAYHWIIQQNHLAKNRWGVYMQYADWVDVAANRFEDNSIKDLFDAGHVTRLTRRSDNPAVSKSPVARLTGPATARVGQAVRWDAAGSRDPAGGKLTFQWDLGDGNQSDLASVEHVFRRPGFYRLGLTVSNGELSDLAWRDLYVTEDVPEVGTEGQAETWSWSDPNSTCRFQSDRRIRLCGAASLRATIQPYSGGRVTLVHRVADAAIPVSERSHVAFWLKTRNPNIPAWQGPNPLVTLVDGEGRELELTPLDDLLSHPPDNEARDGWIYLTVPLHGDDAWRCGGQSIRAVRELRFGFDSWGAPALDLWLDGLVIL